VIIRRAVWALVRKLVEMYGGASARPVPDWAAEVSSWSAFLAQRLHEATSNPTIGLLLSRFRVIELKWLNGAQHQLKLRKHRRMTR
jgi:hypothetical protein